MNAEQTIFTTPEVTPPPPDELVDIMLSADSKLQMETYVTSYGFKGVVGHWGRKYLKEETDAMVAQIWGQDKVTDKTGFSELWKVPPGTTNEHAIEDELAVVSHVTQQVLRVHDLRPEQVDFVFLGSGAAIVDHPDVIRYSRTVAEQNGFGHLIPEDPYDIDAPLYDRYLACYSGASAMRAALLNPKLHGKIGYFINVEGLTRLMIGADRTKSNALPPQFFSNGISAYIMIPGETFKIVLDEYGNPIEEELVVPDKHHSLAARVPYAHLMDQDALKRGEIFQRCGNTEMIFLPEPEDGMMINMNGGRTGTLFLAQDPRMMPQRVNRVAGRELTAHPERITGPTKKRRHLKTNVHPAGYDVVNELNNQTSADVVFEWGLKPDGNTSASGNTIALIRDSKNLKPGDHVLSAVMGGGSIQGAMVLQVGETNIASHITNTL